MLTIVASIAVADFVGDKIPAVDHVLHAAGLVIAPVAGALVAWPRPATKRSIRRSPWCSAW